MNDNDYAPFIAGAMLGYVAGWMLGVTATLYFIIRRGKRIAKERTRTTSHEAPTQKLRTRRTDRQLPGAFAPHDTPKDARRN